MLKIYNNFIGCRNLIQKKTFGKNIALQNKFQQRTNIKNIYYNNIVKIDIII